MSYDKLLVMQQARRWHGAKFASAPRSPTQPMLWVDDAERLRLYHPAVKNWTNPISPPFAWDELTFRRAVFSLRERAGQMITDSLEQKGIPAGYYSSFVEACQQSNLAP